MLDDRRERFPGVFDHRRKAFPDLLMGLGVLSAGADKELLGPAQVADPEAADTDAAVTAHACLAGDDTGIDADIAQPVRHRQVRRRCRIGQFRQAAEQLLAVELGQFLAAQVAEHGRLVLGDRTLQKMRGEAYQVHRQVRLGSAAHATSRESRPEGRLLKSAGRKLEQGP